MRTAVTTENNIHSYNKVTLNVILCSISNDMKNIRQSIKRILLEKFIKIKKMLNDITRFITHAVVRQIIPDTEHHKTINNICINK